MITETSLKPRFSAFLNPDIELRTGTGSGIGDTLVDMLSRLRASNSGETPQVSGRSDRMHSAPVILDEIKATTGLSWNKIAELCEISRRAVYDWLEGKPVADQNYARLLAAYDAIRGLALNAPYQVRTFLLFHNEGGTTPFQLLKEGRYEEFARLAYSDTIPIEEPFVSVADRLDARQEAIHTDLAGPKRSTAARSRHCTKTK